MNKYAFFAYWNNVDPNMLETCISSLRDVSDCIIYIAANSVPKDVEQKLNLYGVQWIWIPDSKVKDRRACCKIEVLNDIVKQCGNNDMIMVSDVDIVFIKDPFFPFLSYPDMDLGLTTRGYKHAFSINAGMFYIKVNDNMRKWLSWHLAEIYNPVWEAYVNHRRKWNHGHYGLDWSVGQDFLVSTWDNKEFVESKMNIKVVDVGPEYNYCPPTDTMGIKAFNMAWKSLDEKSVSVLHLKSDLKKMIYMPKFPNAKLNFKMGKTGWL